MQVINVVNNPIEEGEERWIAFPRTQLFFQYYDGYESFENLPS